MRHTYSLSDFNIYSINLVPLPSPAINTPVTLGSSVPECPIFFILRIFFK